MNKDELAWLDQVLAFWEMRSTKIKTFSCKFQCWEYNSFVSPQEAARYGKPELAQRYSEGAIKYAQPDKGLFRVEKLSVYEPPPPMTPPPANPSYAKQDETLGEHWVCDGKQIFQFDARSRKVIVTPLPPAMQGQAIADGPLPFMFGAKSQTIKARYWVRGLQGPPGKYLLEAVPKSREDARNFKMVHILLDQAEYLPEMLQVFEPNATEQNRYRKTYQFTERQAADEKVGLAALDALLKAFQREFYEPKIPSGWKRELQTDMVQAIAPPAGPRPPQEAQRPAAVQKSFSPGIPR
jgi:TIGR03009 family protein